MKKIFESLKNPIFLLILILILGFIFRILEIDKTSFWFDEAFTGDTIKLPWKDMFSVIAIDKVHPPLYYIFVRLWSYIYGFTQNGIRGFSIFTGMLSILASFFIGKNIFDKEKYSITGLVLALVVSISPFFITYSIEARAYSLITLTTLCLTYSTFKYLSNGYERKYLIASILFGLILCFTHYLQGVFIIGLIIASLFYVFIYGKSKTNRILLISFIAIIIFSLAFVLLLPIKEIFRERGLISSWWIPDLIYTDVFRINYSYLFGVVRYANGVPPMREMIIPVSNIVIAGVIFVIQIISYILVLVSKKIDRGTKRAITFFVLLWSISYFGFIYLGLVGINTLVERYTIACGIIMLLSHFIVFTTLLKGKLIVIPLTIYIIGILLLKPMPINVDYRSIAIEINKLKNEKIVFKYPADFVVTSFYMDRNNSYYLYEFKGEYASWALLTEEKGLKPEEIDDGDILIVQNWEKTEYLGKGYTLVFGNNDFSILEKN